MSKTTSKRLFSIAAVVVILACAFVPAAFGAGTTYTATFSIGVTATMNAGEDLVFAIVCQPPTDITTITASSGTLTAEKTTLGGPSTPQGVINGLWTLSGITGDVTINLDLNTQEGADLPVITIGREEAEAALANSGMGGPGGAPPGEGMPGGMGQGGAPPAGEPGNAPPEGDSQPPPAPSDLKMSQP